MRLTEPFGTDTLTYVTDSDNQPPDTGPLAQNWTALRNRANQARFDHELTIDVLVERSGMARSTVVSLLTSEGDSGRLGSWHRLAHALGVPFPELVSALDDPDLSQPSVLPKADPSPSLPTLIKGILAITPPERAQRISNAELRDLIVNMGYPTVTLDAVRLARWRLDREARDHDKK